MGRRRNKRAKQHSTDEDTSQGSALAVSNSTSSRSELKRLPRIEKLPFTLKEAEEKSLECRLKVNAQIWEEQVEQPLMRERYTSDPPAHYRSESAFLYRLSESSRGMIYSMGLLVARGQNEIAKLLTKHEVFGGWFEKSWTSHQESARIDIIVLALDKTSTLFGSYELGMRRFCPDLSSNLANNGGRGLVELVRFIVQSGNQFEGKDYYPLPNEEFDRYYSMINEEGLPPSRAVRLNQLMLQHERNNYITRFVYHVLKVLGCYDFDEDHIPGTLLQRPRLPFAPLPPSTDILSISSMPRGGNLVDSSSSASKNAKSKPTPEIYPNSRPLTTADNGGRPLPQKIDTCMSCKRFRDEVKELVEGKKQFSYCKRCDELDPPHRIPYCDTECQELDWSTHKRICGRLFEDPDIPQFGLEPAPTLPPLSISLQYKIYRRKAWKEGGNMETGQEENSQLIYGFRIDDAEFGEHSAGGEFQPVWRGKRYVWLGDPGDQRGEEAKDLKKLLDSFDRAVETRAPGDIEAFIWNFWPRIAIRGLLWTRTEAVNQLSEDWDVEVETIKEWVRVQSGSYLCMKYQGGPVERQAVEKGDFETAMKIFEDYRNDPDWPFRGHETPEGLDVEKMNL